MTEIEKKALMDEILQTIDDLKTDIYIYSLIIHGEQGHTIVKKANNVIEKLKEELIQIVE